MKEDTGNIELLFSEAFESYKPEVAVEEWNKLNTALKRQNFMHFGWAHFNIYYTTVVILILGFGIYIGLKKPETPAKPKDEKIQIIKPESVLKPINQIPIQQQSAITERKNVGVTLKKEITNVGIIKPLTSKSSAIIDTSTTNNDKEENKTDLRTNNQLADSNSILKNGIDAKYEKKKIRKVVVIKKKDVIINDTIVRYRKK